MTEAESLARLQEAVARLIDPSSWRVMDSELERMKRKYRGQNIGWPADQFQHKESMAKASAILDFLTRSGGLVLLPSVEDLVLLIGDNAEGYAEGRNRWIIVSPDDLATAIHNHLKGTGDA